MTTLTGSFTASGQVSGPVVASNSLTVAIDGQLSDGFLLIEQSDQQVVWTTFQAFDNALAPVRRAYTDGPNLPGVLGQDIMADAGRGTVPPGIRQTFVAGLVSGRSYRLRCVQFKSGSCSWSLTV